MTAPVPTVAGPVAGYIPTGVRRVIWCPAVAVTSAPTKAEITAGTDYTNVIAEMSGFTGTGALVDQPNMGTRWTPKVPGMISADDSSITFNMALSGTDVRSVFSDGSDGVTAQSTGCVVIAYEGLTVGKKLRVFPVSVTSAQPSTGMGDIATLVVNYGIILPPSGFISIPTA